MKAWEMSERARKVLKEILTTGRYVSACHDRFKFEVDVKAGEQFIEAYATEREAQAVQREREAAKGLAERLTIAIEQLEAHRGLFDPTIIRAHKSVLATYNDNRKG